MQKKILIIEENAAIAQALDRRLRTRGYSLTIATQAEAALAAFEASRPDLVVISLNLAERTGESLCKELRGMPLGKLIPILFLGTGAEAINDVKSAITAGADHYFKKPDQLGELLAKIVTYIGTSASAETLDSTHGIADESAQKNDIKTPGTTGEWAALDEMLRPEDTQSEERAAGESPPDHLAEHLFGLEVDPAAINELEAPTTDSLATPMVKPSARTEFGPPNTSENVSHAALDRLDLGRPVNLQDRGLESVLMDAYSAKLSGRLEIASGGVLRRLFLDDGHLVYSDSSAPEEDLATYLAHEGFITQAALETARESATQSGGTSEEKLIEHGAVTPEDVYGQLKNHVIGRILSLFSLDDGELVVVKGGARPIDPVRLGHSIPRFIVDGIRRKFGRLRLYRRFGTGGQIPQRAQRGAHSEELVLRADESAIVNACDGRRTVLEVARSVRMTEVDVLAVLYGLSIVGLIQSNSQGTLALSAPTDALAPRASEPRTADQLAGYPELVRAKYNAVQTESYFRVLGVSPTATGAEVRMAFEDLRRRFDPHRVSKDSAVWHQVAEIAAVLDDAFYVLSNDRLREQYANKIH